MNIAKHLIKKYNFKTDVIEIPNVTRDDLAELLAEANFRVGVEVGVAFGEYSETMMKANPTMTLYGVDPYECYPGYKDFAKLGTFESMEQIAHDRLDKYPTYHFVKEYSVPASEKFEDESLDFVYIDGNHSEPYVSQDIAAWTPKVRKGGIVAGHDYARIKGNDLEDSKNWAVIPAINRYAKEHGYQLYIWGLEAKLPGLKRDGSRSWMLIK